jgi:hypothetical protein
MIAAMSLLLELHTRINADDISLKTQWIATRQAWRDTVGDRFEREFWQPLEAESSRYLNALRDLDEALRQADINTR